MSKEFREWLKDERKRRGLSQGKLALMIGIDKGYVSQIENGKRPASRLFINRISQVLNINHDMLMCMSGNFPDDIIDILKQHPIKAPRLLRNAFEEGETEKIQPFVVIGPEELEEPLGETITCWICGKEHEVKYGDKVLEDGTREPSKFLAYFNCGERTILCGIDGKVVRPKRRTNYEKSD